MGLYVIISLLRTTPNEDDRVLLISNVNVIIARHRNWSDNLGWKFITRLCNVNPILVYNGSYKQTFQEKYFHLGLSGRLKLPIYWRCGKKTERTKTDYSNNRLEQYTVIYNGIHLYWTEQDRSGIDKNQADWHWREPWSWEWSANCSYPTVSGNSCVCAWRNVNDCTFLE